MVKIIFISLVFVVVGYALWPMDEEQAVAASDGGGTAVTTMESQVLASTIQIEMFAEEWVEGGLGHIRTSRGLGTVVQYGGQRFILTHNHWSIPQSEISQVEFRNSVGDGLLALDGVAFYGLVRYLDEGTLLLDAPAGLDGVAAAELGDGSTLQVGSPAWLATYDDGNGLGIKIETAWVKEVDGSAIPGRLILEGQETAVISGDSGGGVWLDGKVVGNLWAIRVAESRGLGGVAQQIPTGSIVAGIQVLSGVLKVRAGDLEVDMAVENGYENGGMIKGN